MKVVVAVVVFDRFQNIEEWIRVWNQCHTTDAELVIVHNYKNEAEEHAYRVFCQRTNIRYVPRKNVGYDIGAFQDVCKNRLDNFPQDFDYLLWCTDDLFPQKRDFIQIFLSKFVAGVSCVCYEVSREVKLHVRTTGFMVRKEDLPKLEFNVDPIRTKDDCYDFEHRHRTKALLEQIQRYGKIIQVDNVEHSPVWDMGHKSQAANRRFPRRNLEHLANFPKKTETNELPKVVFICPVFNTYPEIIGSLINQTYKNWELILVHDGPSTVFNIKKIVEGADDKRIKYKELPKRTGNFGHKIRQNELNALDTGEFVVITNADNTHSPVYTEWMLKGFTDDNVVATFCSDMTHSYKAWQNIECRLEQGYVDMAGVMIRREVAQSVGFQNTEAHSADWLFFKSIIDKYGADKFNKVTGCLFTHN